MDTVPGQAEARRRFLRMLVASPLLGRSNLLRISLTSLLGTDVIVRAETLAGLETPQQGEEIISSPDQAFPPAHCGYLTPGVDDDGTVRANRESYSRLQIRSRRLVDVETIDMSVRLFGASWSSPIVICPVSSQKAFHPE